MVKNLKFNRLELREKIFVDKPTQQDVSMEQQSNNVVVGQSNASMRSIKPSMAASVVESKPSAKNQEQLELAPAQKPQYRTEDDFLFGLLTASQLQEFPVLKINKKGRQQERILCIDAFNLYNKKHGQKQDVGSKSFFSDISKKLFQSKRKMYSVKFIRAIQRQNLTEFRILIQPEPKIEDFKELRYKTLNPDDCSHIIAKLNFLQTHNNPQNFH